MNHDEALREYLMRMLLIGEIFSYTEGVETGTPFFMFCAGHRYIGAVGKHPVARHGADTPMGAYKVTDKGLDFIRGEQS